MKKIRLKDAYFGVRLYPMSFSNKSERRLETYNLFDFSRVKWSVAKYVTMTDEERKSLLSNPLAFCFGDVWGRCEYEFVVCPWGGLDENDKAIEIGEKMDIYEMYVKPNEKYLMELVDSISKNSARLYLREMRKRYHQ